MLDVVRFRRNCTIILTLFSYLSKLLQPKYQHSTSRLRLLPQQASIPQPTARAHSPWVVGKQTYVWTLFIARSSRQLLWICWFTAVVLITHSQTEVCFYLNLIKNREYMVVLRKKQDPTTTSSFHDFCYSSHVNIWSFRANSVQVTIIHQNTVPRHICKRSLIESSQFTSRTINWLDSEETLLNRSRFTDQVSLLTLKPRQRRQLKDKQRKMANPTAA